MSFDQVIWALIVSLSGLKRQLTVISLSRSGKEISTSPTQEPNKKHKMIKGYFMVTEYFGLTEK
jgi:hypothetical protein